MSEGTGRQNIIILFWICLFVCFGGCTVSFLGIHKWEPDIYLGFTLALHLQCMKGIDFGIHTFPPSLNCTLVLYTQAEERSKS